MKGQILRMIKELYWLFFFGTDESGICIMHSMVQSREKYSTRAVLESIGKMCIRIMILGENEIGAVLLHNSKSCYYTSFMIRPLH
jgi:hypothetical protein